MSLKTGSRVRQVTPIIEGVIREKRLNQDADEIEYHVDYTGDDKEEHSRWFLESQLEQVEEAAPAEEGAQS